MNMIENALPLDELAMTGRIEEAGGIGQEEDKIQCRGRGARSRKAPPRESSANTADEREGPEDHQSVRRVVTVFTAWHCDG